MKLTKGKSGKTLKSINYEISLHVLLMKIQNLTGFIPDQTVRRIESYNLKFEKSFPVIG